MKIAGACEVQETTLFGFEGVDTLDDGDYAPLAQLVEQLTLNQWVPGSNP